MSPESYALKIKVINNILPRKPSSMKSYDDKNIIVSSHWTLVHSMHLICFLPNRSLSVRLVVLRGGLHQDRVHVLADRGRVRGAGRRRRAGQGHAHAPGTPAAERQGTRKMPFLSQKGEPLYDLKLPSGIPNGYNILKQK